MVSLKSVESQLKHIRFNAHAWGKAEARELTNILLPDEVIYECVNGFYEGGFALLCATNVRLLLVDKKPLNYLTVEDLRFDMINEIDYSHRMLGARISVSTGSKNLKFKSYNQQRLRKLIGHVQHCMAEFKQQQSMQAQTQQEHLEKINEQLQVYLLSQHEQQQELRRQLDLARTGHKSQLSQQPDPVKPSSELSDFLFAKTLLKQYQDAHKGQIGQLPQRNPETVQSTIIRSDRVPDQQQTEDLYSEGMREVFGKSESPETNNVYAVPKPHAKQPSSFTLNPLEINPLRIAYSKLPMALRNRRFSRPSFRQAASTVTPQVTPSVPPQVL